ncbi:metallophosphoesterase family protein [Schlesneria paludicola]|uniref:metallophosphoesterase family protein n=1 Tax=Schlesneria paludicola TaxID=360056 RepID=UPI00029B0B09|nr:metallophosphoesterase family protein [Schlesneria paludicola]
MKILVLADIHANWFALQSIRESFDACLFLGDLVEYGVDPIPCIDWVRKNATCSIRGNHDHSVAQRVPPPTGTGFRRLAGATRQLHWDVLRPSHVKYLSQLPVTQNLTLDGLRFHLVHATPRDPMDEYLASDPLGWEKRLESIEADFVCVGHTHIPFHLKLSRCQLLNPGSIGQPRDGDPRAAYAIIQDGHVELKRVDYDVEAAVAQIEQSGLEPELVELASQVLRTGGRGPKPT